MVHGACASVNTLVPDGHTCPVAVQTAKQQAAAALAEHEAQQPESPITRRRALQEVQEQARLAEEALAKLRQQQLAVQARLQQVGAAGATGAKASQLTNL